jgi:hypothetical protein
MSLKPLTLTLLFLIALHYFGKAQLFPAGTKLHVAQLGSYFETQHQNYLNTSVYNDTLNSKQYTFIRYPDWRASHHELRIDSNRLYQPYGMNEVLLFDFNAKVNDSLTIYQHVFNSGKPVNPSILIGPARIRIDSITYEYFYTEKDERDSLKKFYYSGNVTLYDSPYSPGDTYSFNFSIIEKIITIFTTGSLRSYLSFNAGPRTASDDHERLRCVEYPDGKSMKMEWWYKMAGNNYACDYRFTLGNDEIQPKPHITPYPNPASSQIILSNYSGPTTIFNHLGQQVLSTQTETGKSIDVSTYNNGLYYIKIDSHQRIPFTVIH